MATQPYTRNYTSLTDAILDLMADELEAYSQQIEDEDEQQGDEEEQS